MGQCQKIFDLLVVHLHLRISPQIFDKIQNYHNVIYGDLGEMIHEKILNQKISWHCPFNIVSLNVSVSPLKMKFRSPK